MLFHGVSRPFSSPGWRTQLSQPAFIGEVVQLSQHLCGPAVGSFQQVHNFLVLEIPQNFYNCFNFNYFQFRFELQVLELVRAKWVIIRDSSCLTGILMKKSGNKIIHHAHVHTDISDPCTCSSLCWCNIRTQNQQDRLILALLCSLTSCCLQSSAQTGGVCFKFCPPDSFFPTSSHHWTLHSNVLFHRIKTRKDLAVLPMCLCGINPIFWAGFCLKPVLTLVA